MTALINTPKLAAQVLQQLAESLASYDSLAEHDALDPQSRLVTVVEALLHGDEAELDLEEVAFLRSLGGAAGRLADAIAFGGQANTVALAVPGCPLARFM